MKFLWHKELGSYCWGENGESEDEFLGESDSDNECAYCEFSYNNHQNKESIQITEKKEPDANCLGTQAKATFCT